MESICPTGKSSWPELVGTDGETAKATILSENPDVTVVIIKEGDPVPLDFLCDRVRVVVNDDSLVVSVPRIG